MNHVVSAVTGPCVELIRQGSRYYKQLKKTKVPSLFYIVASVLSLKHLLLLPPQF